MNKIISNELIEDVQNTPDNRHLDIDKVGIKAIKHPIVVKDRSGIIQHTNATFSMYVHLPHNFKGTHMSRFVEILNENEREISVESFEDILKEMLERLESKSGYLEMQFTYFINKKAPVSGAESLMDYEVSFIGEMVDGKILNTVRVIVPVTSLCPCSKKISKYGAHNQRAHITLTLQTNGFIWIEDIIEQIEKQASCELYGILKRPDEKYVTEKAYENPKFVEDIVRDIATELKSNKKVSNYIIESENFESIHNHSAYALIKGNNS
jgi:GTP cyclohydrolase I|tara:strand:- start:118 stop:918 length:801 start_codon:yes stop_codon:yes gene_type:complete